jgi:DNA polymerase I-like protein with 3'-5' exonuclease and polymerase domains
VYGQFHLLRGSGGGTRSGRFASSTPNLQNIPSRDEELAPLVRGLFVPDEGYARWLQADYSQIEYRFLAHFAIGDKAEDVRERYKKQPDTDYHVFTGQLIEEITGLELKRKAVKTINFGLCYGMGKTTLTTQLNLDRQVAEELFTAYHQGVPFTRQTLENCSQIASKTGVITTILGRKSRFDMWESSIPGDNRPALPYDKAIKTYYPCRRAYTHKALNRRLQGSAADLMKMGMLRCYEDGIFKVTGVPHLTVHDEVDFSDSGNTEEAFKEMVNIMENAISLRVPIKMDISAGKDWGHLKKIEI